ncbi:MAG: xanthine dehydrogenase family protein molybdopterin-binding subunit [Alphaproteobacteria bacterium]|nr:xanthine dehydrogenase family protein molybdopterin-binding subunit [Alphaproteobacteria bacterium]
MTDQSARRFVSVKRRPKEDGRFIAGTGHFVADINRPGMLHVSLVTSPYPAARITSIKTADAMAAPGVIDILTGDTLASGVNPLSNSVDTPGVRCYPLAHEVVRYAGEWVVAVIAGSRALAEDAAELIEINYSPLDHVIDAERALDPASPPVHEGHGSNILYQRTFTWGPVAEDFASQPNQLSFKLRWGRSAPVPVETFGVVAEWNPGTEILDVWASIQMPSYAEQIAGALRVPVNQVRAHYDVDVGGSYGVKRGIKHTVLAGFLARRLGRPVRLIEDRLENMIGGDMHGPDRHFNVSVAFGDGGLIKSMKLRVIEDVGGQTGRAPFQLGKPVSAIVGAYQINSVEYEAIAVSTNKTGQAAVRGFGMSPTNVAIETAVDKVARQLGLSRLEVRRRNFIRSDQFPYLIPSGSEYDSGDYHTVLGKARDLAQLDDLIARRDAARRVGKIAGIGIATCLEPGGGNSAFEPLLNPKNETTTWPESCVVKVDRTGGITATIATSTAGQGHETLAATIIGEELGIDPDRVRVLHSDTLSGMPGNTPVASRMAIMLGGAAAGAAQKVRDRAILIGAHNLGRSPDQVRYADGKVTALDDPSQSLTLARIALISHREFHNMPPGLSEPGMQVVHVMQVPKGGTLPTADGRVQMYPCYSFSAHIVYTEIDRLTGKVTLPDYIIAHDCGTVINPDIVRGMVIGGAAHGIGAALYEEFSYEPGGQLLSGTFVDYVMPSSHEIPDIKLAEHCTPSPLTSHGQKGVGEGGYLGAPAAVSSAINDALDPYNIECLTLPMRASLLSDLLAQASVEAENYL